MAESESVANLQSSSFSSLMAAVFVSFRFGSSMHVESVDSRARLLIGQLILSLLFNQSNRRIQVRHQLPLIITSDSFFSPSILLLWNNYHYDLRSSSIKYLWFSWKQNTFLHIWGNRRKNTIRSSQIPVKRGVLCVIPAWHNCFFFYSISSASLSQQLFDH